MAAIIIPIIIFVFPLILTYHFLLEKPYKVSQIMMYTRPNFRFIHNVRNGYISLIIGSVRQDHYKKHLGGYDLFRFLLESESDELEPEPVSSTDGGNIKSLSFLTFIIFSTSSS